MITAEVFPNRTAPRDDRGWSCVGTFYSPLGPSSAVAVSPRHVLTAAENAPSDATPTFTLGDVAVEATGFAAITPDVRLYRVAGTLPAYALLYEKSDELNQQVALIGCGETNGEPVTTAGTQNGWRWGVREKSWGMSCVDAVLTDPAPALRLGCCDFRGRHCATPAEHDLGGGAFIHDGPHWKLAGLLTSVEPEDYKLPNGHVVRAGIFSAKNLYPARTQNALALRVSAVAEVIRKAIAST